MEISGLGGMSYYSSLFQNLNKTSEDANKTNFAQIQLNAEQGSQAGGPGALIQKLEELQQEDPEKFSEFMEQAVAELESAAGSAEDEQTASFLQDLADKFEEAAETGDLSVLAPPQGAEGMKGAPPPPPPGGGMPPVEETDEEDEEDAILSLLEQLQSEDESVFTEVIASITEQLESISTGSQDNTSAALLSRLAESFSLLTESDDDDDSLFPSVSSTLSAVNRRNGAAMYEQQQYSVTNMQSGSAQIDGAYVQNVLSDILGDLDSIS